MTERSKPALGFLSSWLRDATQLAAAGKEAEAKAAYERHVKETLARLQKSDKPPDAA